MLHSRTDPLPDKLPEHQYQFKSNIGHSKNATPMADLVTKGMTNHYPQGRLLNEGNQPHTDFKEDPVLKRLHKLPYS